MPDPVEQAYKQMREMTRPLPAIPDNRGPLVQDLTNCPSLNGIDPFYKDKEGCCNEDGSICTD